MSLICFEFGSAHRVVVIEVVQELKYVKLKHIVRCMYDIISLSWGILSSIISADTAMNWFPI